MKLKVFWSFLPGDFALAVCSQSQHAFERGLHILMRAEASAQGSQHYHIKNMYYLGASQHI